MSFWTTGRRRFMCPLNGGGATKVLSRRAFPARWRRAPRPRAGGSSGSISPFDLHAFAWILRVARWRDGGRQRGRIRRDRRREGQPVRTLENAGSGPAPGSATWRARSPRRGPPRTGRERRREKRATAAPAGARRTVGGQHGAVAPLEQRDARRAGSQAAPTPRPGTRLPPPSSPTGCASRLHSRIDACDGRPASPPRDIAGCRDEGLQHGQASVASRKV